MGQVNLDHSLAGGRDAVSRHAWRDAYQLLRAADQASSLDAEDLESLAEAAWWNGRADECISARERAYALHIAADRPRRAALMAVSLANEHFSLRQAAVGQAWVSRAETLLKDQPEGAEHGYLVRLRVRQASAGGDADRALELARKTLEIGSRSGERDLVALGLQDQGRILIDRGQVQEGLALLEEASAAALSGELTPHTTGVIYCNLIGVCEDMADYGRAAEWTDAARRWCDRMAIAGFPGMCRVHRADVIRLRGAWQEAELEAQHAFDELRNFQVGYAAEAQYLIGEIRLWQGDLPEAREAFERAHELGRDPNPGLALLQLAEGKVEAAANAIRRGLSQAQEPLMRAKLLPAQVAIARAAGDRSDAEAAAQELKQTALVYNTPALNAHALVAEGIVALMAARNDAAVRSLCEALTLWRRVEAPYEEARTRVTLAESYADGGDVDGAALELRAARNSFRRLGARLDEQQAETALARLGQPPESADPVGEARVTTFMFTDIVRSTALVDAIGDESWNELLRWHDGMLRGLIGQHSGEAIKHVGDGIFASFGRPQQAIGAAVSIQRALAEHRRDHGFAPQVRIGVHQAAAKRIGQDYRGKGVHEAARIAAAAQGGEILATLHTVQPCDFAVSEPRPVTLRGITEPVQVVTVSWR